MYIFKMTIKIRTSNAINTIICFKKMKFMSEKELTYMNFYCIICVLKLYIPNCLYDLARSYYRDKTMCTSLKGQHLNSERVFGHRAK
jgi:hypothetical protein